MSDTNNIYDISKFTDKQLYDILDISNPTDRELEAKILYLIRKYNNIQNEDGMRLLKFFEDIYDHFFQNDDEEDENDIEGFDVNPTTPEKPTLYVGPTAMINIPIPSGIDETITNEKKDGDKPKKDDEKTKSQLVTNADYVPDSLRLNPLLKQTIKRIICIDSQYRDVTVYPNTNNFGFDLSEPLRDVVSLKLYSIQIPYTWYTISKSYGSNFFYLKGQTDGINNGLHDYKIEITAGNYTSETLVAALNDGIKKLSNEYPDTSFNNTNIAYNGGNSITTITADIQKTYTESYYTLQFPSWTPSVYYTDSSFNTASLSDIERNTSIASYLGFNYANYSPNVIISNETIRSTNYINVVKTDKKFLFDNSNNYFTVVQYIGPSLYSENSNIINTYKIQLYDSSGNILNSNGDFTKLFSKEDIKTFVNDAIIRENIFTPDSQLSQYDISGLVINANNSCYKLKLMFDRNKVMYQPNSKMAVIFPYENPANYNFYIVWTMSETESGYHSGFYFKYLINDFSVISSELPIVKSNFTTNNARVYYTCNTPNYMVNNKNDFSFNIPSGDYTLSQYILQLNTQLRQQTPNNIKIIEGAGFNIVDSKIKCIMDFNQTFTEKNYIVYYDNTSLLCSTLNLTPTSDLSGSDASGNFPLELYNIFNSSFTISYAGYILDSSYIMTILPKPGTPNENEPPRILSLSKRNYPNYTQLLNDIQNTFITYNIVDNSINDIQLPYSQTFITKTANTTTNIVDISFTLKISYTLTEANYIMSFYPQSNIPTNPWNILGLDPSYNLYTYLFDASQNRLAYSTINGDKLISENQINIVDGSNTLLITANYDPSGGVYSESGSNNIEITIPSGNYTTNSLLDAINNKFNSNPYTYGSKIYQELDNYTDDYYIKISLNVNRIYTSSDYSVVFYDPFSFASCNSNVQGGIQNVTWDTTIGWILGYRDYTSYRLTFENQRNIKIQEKTNYYYLQSYNSVYTIDQKYSDTTNTVLTNTVIKLSADTTLTTSLYNYFVISLDDYNQNHINDGLVTITRSQTSIKPASYASSSEKICDPITKKIVNQSSNNLTGNNLTANQIYAINQANASQSAVAPIYSAGPYIKDLFAYVPIKAGTNGTYFIEYGGGLQAQERLYFGPVNIRKMSIQLMNDRGDFLDLNGSNWSFSFICEQLYRSGNSSANK
jgi:hypothetical protein